MGKLRPRRFITCSGCTAGKRWRPNPSDSIGREPAGVGAAPGPPWPPGGHALTAVDKCVRLLHLNSVERRDQGPRGSTWGALSILQAPPGLWWGSRLCVCHPRTCPPTGQSPRAQPPQGPGPREAQEVRRPGQREQSAPTAVDAQVWRTSNASTWCIARGL